MKEFTMASVADDETVARRAIQAAVNVLEDSGLKGQGPAIAWSRTDFPEVRKVLAEAHRTIRQTLLAEYGRRELRTIGWHGLIVDTQDLLLMSAVQAWLAGGNALSIHPFSASSYTWLAVSTFTAMRHMEDEHHELCLDLWELDEKERIGG
jgi:hypothetical protein